MELSSTRLSLNYHLFLRSLNLTHCSTGPHTIKRLVPPRRNKSQLFFFDLMSCLQNPQTLINLRCKSIQAMNWVDSRHSPTSDYSVSLSLYDISHVPYRECRCVWNSVRTTTGWLLGLRWRQRSRLQLRVRSAQRWSACTAWTLWTIRAPSSSSWTQASAPPTFWPPRTVRSTTTVIKHSTRCSCLNPWEPEYVKAATVCNCELSRFKRIFFSSRPLRSCRADRNGALLCDKSDQ